jgi:hypothetical protein
MPSIIHLKPCHLPILLATSLALMTTPHTDARVHHTNTYKTTLIMDFMKRLQDDVTTTDDSNSTTSLDTQTSYEYYKLFHAGMTPALVAIYELKLAELQLSVHRAKRMLETVRHLEALAPATET